uniref:Uncharacterized protein n=1 Tax=Parascaris equorum TaxID=6256 RepID=A0A914R244_PAREQ
MKALIIFIAIVGIAFAQGQQGEQGPPPFLVGAPANVVDEFKQLVNGAPDKTDAEVDRDIENWIARQGPKVKVWISLIKQL